MTAGFDTGSVRLRLRGEGGKVLTTDVCSQRPLVAGLLKGRRADDAVTLLPKVFAVCGRAQGLAAQLAVSAARGEELLPCLVPDIVSEVMREHLWRYLLDLPALFSLLPMHEQFLNAVRWVDADQREALRTLLAACEISRLSESIEAMEQPPPGKATLLQVHSARASLGDWGRLDLEMSRMPTWHGHSAETGAYARYGGDTVTSCGAFAARWLARLAELETWAAGGQNIGTGGTASAVSVAPGVGRALVETARGLLMHEVALENDRISDYRIVAPTEWNFHPQGPLPGWLIGRDCSNEVELRRFAAHAVAALDPCVRWELTLE
ncbi:Hydrogenase expression/formation protein HupK [Candidatus Propionivibrio aalborgensis]|uniref:Hydrogenase expression/formation protein HupK n=1 Tax=Candidatus Propionivibrio aalborgensis TaxID=1860101 RepID=A0A1A8XQQ8_9RHOO|nr:nickel-dependent hydrogenase large subunit [Candidatus Propionivibrio aalborgensis]SBT06787.1 Hydrogenase expression/formation protein HupK [Candidatus Propionivibrio aalborgensis]